jgi:hypothetical protein
VRILDFTFERRSEALAHHVKAIVEMIGQHYPFLRQCGLEELQQ